MALLTRLARPVAGVADSSLGSASKKPYAPPSVTSWMPSIVAPDFGQHRHKAQVIQAQDFGPIHVDAHLPALACGAPVAALLFALQAGGGDGRGRQDHVGVDGDVRAWSIEAARNEANRLRVALDGRIDPRGVERQQQAAKAVKESAAAARAVTVGEVWSAYLEARRPQWGARHYKDHETLGKAGGRSCQTGNPWPLHSLLALPLRDLDAPTIEAWAARETKTRPTSARLAWRCLKAFLGWCAEQPQYAPVLPSVNPAKTKKTREALGKAGIKQDALMREQLTVWFDAVRQMQNPVIAAYLQTLLLAGARPGEVLALRWDEINVKWRGLTIRDKVEGERVTPFDPLRHALAARFAPPQ